MVRARAFNIPTDKPEADGTLLGLDHALCWWRFQAAEWSGLVTPILALQS